MFNCEFCRQTSKSGEVSQTIVTKRKKVLYGLFDKNKNQVGKKLGWEVIKEQRACNKCYALYTQKAKGE